MDKRKIEDALDVVSLGIDILMALLYTMKNMNQ